MPGPGRSAGDLRSRMTFAEPDSVSDEYGNVTLGWKERFTVAANVVPRFGSEAVEAAIRDARAKGPYGSFPKGRLSREDMAGPVYRVGSDTARVLGPRLAAAFAHVHLLVFHPRDAEPAALQALLDASWSTTDIVTLSQITAFLSFQIRVVAGLRTLAGRS